MLVKVRDGHQVYREGYLRKPEDGVFRLYKTPEKVGAVDAEGNVDMKAYLGRALVEASDYEKQVFEHTDGDEEFADTVLGDDPEAVMGRAGAITMAVAALDPDKDDHWTQDGEPACAAIEDLAKLHNVKRSEVDAALSAIPGMMGYRRPAKGKGAARQQFSENG